MGLEYPVRREYYVQRQRAQENKHGITLGPELEAALNELARRKGIPPEVLALSALRAQFIAQPSPVQPQDQWERQLFGAAVDCGVSISDSALSSDGLNE